MLHPSFPFSPVKHTAATLPPNCSLGLLSGPLRSSAQTASSELNIQGETQLNEESTWWQTKSHNFCMTLVHYVALNFQQESQKSARETGGLPSVWVPTSLALCPPSCSCKYATCISEGQNKDANIFGKGENLFINIFSRFINVSILDIHE